MIPGIFAVLLATIGGYYVFVSPAASRLAEFEDARTNRLRVRLRQAGGITMILISASIFAIDFGYNSKSRWTMLIALAAVFILLMTLMILALIDIRLTQKLRDSQRKRLAQTPHQTPDQAP